MKFLLAGEQVYSLTDDDLGLNAALDAFATLEPFTVGHDIKKWVAVIARAGSRGLEERLPPAERKQLVAQFVDAVAIDYQAKVVSIAFRRPAADVSSAG